jgi:hypothetical protein
MNIFLIFGIVLLHVFPMFMTYLMGIYNAAQTSKSDYPSLSWIWLKRHTAESYLTLQQYYSNEDFREEIIKYSSSMRAGIVFNLKDLWYIGSNEYYPSPGGFPFNNYNDFWHRMKSFWVYLISMYGLSCFSVGAYWILLLLIYGSTIFVWIDFIIIICIVGLAHYFQGSAFSGYYNKKLDSRYSTYTKLTEYIIKIFLDDWKYPTFSTPKDRMTTVI